MLSSPLLKTKTQKEILYAVILAVLLCLGIYLLFHNLEERGIIAYDEARHGVNAYEMLKNDDWVVHTYQGEVDDWNLKPPLSYWCIMISYKLFGFNCFAFRFHSALSILLLMLIVALWTKKRHGRLVSIVALLFLLANYAFYATHSGRTGDADALYLLFSTIAMLCMLDSARDPRWLYGSAVCFGFAFLAKSFHAMIIPLTCFLCVCATGGLKQLKLKDSILLIFFGLLPVLPWAIARYMRDGMTFFSAMLQTDVQNRVTDGAQGGEWDNWYFYLSCMVNNPTVVAGASLCAMGLGNKMATQKKPATKQTGLMLWMVVPVVAFSFSSFKLHHYIFTAYIGLAIAAGWTTDALYRSAKRGFLFTAGCVALAAVLVFDIGSNVKMVNDQAGNGSYQSFIAETLDRDVDSDKHVYIQYSDALSAWSQADVLRAQLSGDVICINGGVEAFEQDDEDALLIVDKACFDDEMLEYYPVYNESYYLYMLEN